MVAKMPVKPTSTSIESITSAGLAVADSKPAAINRYRQIMAAMTCSWTSLTSSYLSQVVRQVQIASNAWVTNSCSPMPLLGADTGACRKAGWTPSERDVHRPGLESHHLLGGSPVSVANAPQLFERRCLLHIRQSTLALPLQVPSVRCVPQTSWTVPCLQACNAS